MPRTHKEHDITGVGLGVAGIGVAALVGLWHSPVKFRSIQNQVNHLIEPVLFSQADFT